jgi:hypothetical protein
MDRCMRVRMSFTIAVEQEEDGRWLAEIPQIPGVVAYGPTRGEVIAVVACASDPRLEPVVSWRRYCVSVGV